MPIRTDAHFTEYGYRLRDQRVPEHTKSNHYDTDVEGILDMLRDDLMDAIAQAGSDTSIHAIIRDGALDMVNEVAAHIRGD